MNTSYKSLTRKTMLIGLLSMVGCHGGDDGRKGITGTVNIKGQPVPSGTLVLTPKTGEQMPVAARVSEGKFVFDRAIGPRPGPYIAHLNQDEATIEEISQTAELNPSEAAKRFNAKKASSMAPSKTIVEISEVPQQVISIELK